MRSSTLPLVFIPHVSKVLVWSFKFVHVYSIAKKAPNAAKALAKLAAFLRAICHKLHDTAKALVVLSQPFQQGYAVVVLKFIPVFVSANICFRLVQ
jgi:hypothetical protein